MMASLGSDGESARDSEATVTEESRGRLASDDERETTEERSAWYPGTHMHPKVSCVRPASDQN
jgi:hypothetical protein